MNAGTPLASNFSTLYESPDAATIYAYTPGITKSPTGRLIATIDLGGPGPVDMPDTRVLAAEQGIDGLDHHGRIYTSDDHGDTWTHRGNFPYMHARPFCAGDSVYVLGHRGDLLVVRSDDDGDTWSLPSTLTADGYWHQSACNVHSANGCVYLVMERLVAHPWASHTSAFAPVLMRGAVTDDLTQPASWTYASELVFQEAIPIPELDWFGVPFFHTDIDRNAGRADGGTICPLGWLETNVVQFLDPDHVWHDPTGHTFHLIARAYTGGTGYAALAKVTEHDDGSMTTSIETAPSGRRVAFLPCPGGQMKFYILYDEASSLYWLLSSQATDSMTRPDRLEDERFDLPNNERHRLQLHFSRNCVDWLFAGIVDVGGSPLREHGRRWR